MIKKLVFVIGLILAAASSTYAATVSLEAEDGQTIQGGILYKDIAIPESRQVGFVELTVIEDGTGKHFVFRDEDRSCILLPVMACDREATRLKWLEAGKRVRVTQHDSYWTGRKSFQLELLNEQTQ